MIPPDTLFLGFLIIIGLCFGSFYNVVILRGLSGESIAFPGSKCPKCNTPLKWRHNIPLLSYILLGGKCSYCKCKISIQYPIVEFFTMVLFVCAYLKWGFTIKALFAVIYFSLFLITSVTDILERVILTKHAYILAGAGLFYSISALYYPSLINNLNSDGNPIFISISGIIIGVLVMEILARSGYLIAGRRAFGEGDSYIAGALGAIFGWKYILLVLGSGFIIQFLFALPLFVHNLYKQKENTAIIEFALFLVLAWILKAYSSSLGLIIYICGLILLVFIAAILIRNIIRNINKTSGGTYLPYVPALIAASFAGIFLWF